MSHTIQASRACASQRAVFRGALRATSSGMSSRPVFHHQAQRTSTRVAAADSEGNSGVAKRAAVPRVEQPADKPTTVQEVQNNPVEGAATIAKQFVSDPIGQVQSFVEYGLATAENLPDTIRRLGEGVAEGDETQPASRPDATSPAYKGTPTSREGPRE